MSAEQAKSRWKKRRWLILPAIALVIAGGLFAWYRASRGQQLQPVARYHWIAEYEGHPLRFSAQGVGYPATGTVFKGSSDILEPSNSVLNDRCFPLDATITTGYISPTRAAIAWVTWNGPDAQFNFRCRDGRQAQIPTPKNGWIKGLIPCSDSVFCFFDSAGSGRIWLYAPDGRSLPPPLLARNMRMAVNVASAEDLLIPLTDWKRLLLYDMTARKIVLSTPFPLGVTAMIWRQQERLLLAPRFGNALIFDGTTQTASIAPGADGWRWGEDGTVWTLSGGTLQVLHWRAGKPALVNIPTRGNPGTRYGSLAPGSEFRENAEPDWAAAWGDGWLVASVDELATGNTAPSPALERMARTLHVKLAPRREGRRLTLYRGHRCLGTFLLPRRVTIPNSPPIYTGSSARFSEKTDNHEHLAFTVDGTYLSWAIDDGAGVQLFVFQVPPS